MDCECENPDYDDQIEYDEVLGCNYLMRDCKKCGYYWEGPLYGSHG